MVIRQWSARVSPEREEEYLSKVRQKVLPVLAQHEGYLGAFFSRRRAQSTIEYQVISLWDSLESIQGFAGPEPDVAVVPDDIAPTLLNFDSVVEHFEVKVAHELSRLATATDEVEER